MVGVVEVGFGPGVGTGQLEAVAELVSNTSGEVLDVVDHGGVGAGCDHVVVGTHGQAASGVGTEDGVNRVVLGVVAEALAEDGVPAEECRKQACCQRCLSTPQSPEATEGRRDVGDSVVDALRIHQAVNGRRRC